MKLGGELFAPQNICQKLAQFSGKMHQGIDREGVTEFSPKRCSKMATVAVPNSFRAAGVFIHYYDIPGIAQGHLFDTKNTSLITFHL